MEIIKNAAMGLLDLVMIVVKPISKFMEFLGDHMVVTFLLAVTSAIIGSYFANKGEKIHRNEFRKIMAERGFERRDGFKFTRNGNDFCDFNSAYSLLLTETAMNCTGPFVVHFFIHDDHLFVRTHILDEMKDCPNCKDLTPGKNHSEEVKDLGTIETRFYRNHLIGEKQ